MGLRNGGTRETLEALLAGPITDACILWPHGRTQKGYGKMTRGDGKPALVHVVSTERAYGQRPSPQHDAAHSCRNRHCINPRHLRWATKSENSIDRHRDGTVTQSKLTADQVYEIRRLAAGRLLRQRDIASRFGVCLGSIESIVARRTWRHLPERNSA